jgi:hypothetical protein
MAYSTTALMFIAHYMMKLLEYVLMEMIVLTYIAMVVTLKDGTIYGITKRVHVFMRLTPEDFV